jgi:hypothetical protein
MFCIRGEQRHSESCDVGSWYKRMMTSPTPYLSSYAYHLSWTWMASCRKHQSTILERVKTLFLSSAAQNCWKCGQYLLPLAPRIVIADWISYRRYTADPDNEWCQGTKANSVVVCSSILGLCTANRPMCSKTFIGWTKSKRRQDCCRDTGQRPRALSGSLVKG